VAAGDWGETRVLVVPGARFVPADVRAAVGRWAAGGGGVVLLGDGCLSLDPYRKPFADRLEGLATAPVVPGTLDGAALRDALLPLLRQAEAGPVVSVVAADGSLPWGIEWRTATFEGRSLVNLVNLAREPRTVRPESPLGPWRDLISGKTLPAEVALPPMRPVLATPVPR
jgi:hypothetical protein